MPAVRARSRPDSARRSGSTCGGPRRSSCPRESRLRRRTPLWGCTRPRGWRCSGVPSRGRNSPRRPASGVSAPGTGRRGLGCRRPCSTFRSREIRGSWRRSLRGIPGATRRRRRAGRRIRPVPRRCRGSGRRKPPRWTAGRDVRAAIRPLRPARRRGPSNRRPRR